MRRIWIVVLSLLAIAGCAGQGRGQETWVYQLAGYSGGRLDEVAGAPGDYAVIDLALVPGETRDSLAGRMTALIVRASEYAKQRRPGFLIVPQNSPELRHQPGYLAAIDGIGVEDLFFRAHDQPCREDWCAENLANVRALKAAGKFVLAVDYAKRPENVEQACARYREEGFAGYVSTVDLDRVSAGCG
ncbi:endo alpha-1,4 polygalactosaminidase [Flindersiella endophytica]